MCHFLGADLFPWQEVPLGKLFPQIKKEDAEKTLQSDPLAILVSDVAVPIGVTCKCCSKGKCCPAGKCHDVEEGDVCPPNVFRPTSESDCEVYFPLGGEEALKACDAQCKDKFRVTSWTEEGDAPTASLSLSSFLPNFSKNECVETLESAYPGLNNQLALWVEGEISMADIKTRFPAVVQWCQEMVDLIFDHFRKELLKFCTDCGVRFNFPPSKEKSPSKKKSPPKKKSPSTLEIILIILGAVFVGGCVWWVVSKSKTP